MNFKYFLPTLSIFVLIYGTACNSKPEENQANTEAIPVKTQIISPSIVSFPIVCTGIVASDQEARLSFKTGGVIASLSVDEGETVRKGQLLGSLSLNEINAQVAQANEGVEKARRDLQRAESLFQDKAATTEQVQNAKTGLTVAEQNLNIAKFNQQYSSIVSPVNGKVLRKLMNEGELAGPGSPVFIVESDQSNDRIVKTTVSDVDWVRLSLNDTAKIELDAYPGIEFTAIVAEIAAAADQMTGTFPIKLRFVNLSKAAATGMVGKITITPQKPETQMLVPMEALYEANEGKAMIYVLNSDKKTVSRKEIKIINILKDQAAIVGLDGAAEIVTSGVSYLRDKSTVTVKNN